MSEKQSEYKQDDFITILPHSRVRKIMKSDPDVKKVGQDASTFLAKSTVFSFFSLIIIIIEKITN